MLICRKEEDGRNQKQGAPGEIVCVGIDADQALERLEIGILTPLDGLGDGGQIGGEDGE